MNANSSRALALASVTLMLFLSRAAAQPTAFAYQGQLIDRTGPALGIYDLRFTLRDAATGGAQVPGTPTLSGPVSISNGLFTVTLDFGASAFTGAPRWLEIGVRTNGSAVAHTVLAPRSALTATPYAVAAGTAAALTGPVGDAQLPGTVARLNTAQTFTAPVTFAPPSGPPFVVNSTGRVTNLNADLLDGFHASAFWNLAGNAGTTPSQFLGTTDNQPLVFRVNNAPAWRLEPNPISPNVIGGHPGNSVAPGVAGALVASGGALNATNLVAAAHSAIVGGRANRILAGSTASAIGGGDSNTVGNILATISGGSSNRATGPFSTVAGGFANAAAGNAASVLGGANGQANEAYATVLGGVNNLAAGYASAAGGAGAQALDAGTFVWADASSSTPFTSTGPNQFLIRADGGVGIGGAPLDAALDVEGDMHLNDFEIFLRAGVDRNHGFGWYGTGKPFAGQTIDGPVAYGWSGGALGSLQGGQRAVLRWLSSGHVGIGITPAARLHVADTAQTVALFEGANSGGSWLSLANTAGGRTWSLISTGPANGETAGQLVFYTGGAKVTFRDSGHVGIGTIAPGDRLEVFGPDATIRVRNQGDALGGFIGNTFSALQLGLYNPTAAAIDAVPAGAKRSFFGFDRLGRVGSLNNNYGNPTFRNLLDDGTGNLVVSGAGSLQFGATTRQMLNLWNANYGLGVQANTLYARSDGNFAWYRNGAHADSTYDPGGGTTLMRLDSGGLTVNTTFISSSDRTKKENFAPVRARTVLDRLVAMPIQHWNYKDDAGVRHIGPTAQDFNAAFQVGCDDKHIAMVDADGVALAAIQGLHEMLQEKSEQIESLRHENATLQQRLDALERKVQKLSQP